MNKQLFIAIGAIGTLLLGACGTAQTKQVTNTTHSVTSEARTTQTQMYESLRGDWKGLNKHKKTVLKLVLDKVNTAQKSTAQKDHAFLTGVAYLPLAVEGEGPYTVSGQIKTSRTAQSTSSHSHMQLSIQLRKSRNVYYKLSCNTKQSISIWKCELENMPSTQNGMSNKRVSKFSLSKVG